MDFPPRPGSSVPRRDASEGDRPDALEDGSGVNGDLDVPSFAREAEVTASEEIAEATERPLEPRPLPPEERGEAPPKPARGSRKLRGETLRRLLWALPWILFAIVVVAVGGPLFAVAMTGLAWAVMVEFFRMTQRARPFQVVALASAAGMILAAHFGDSFHIVLAGVAFFPVMLGFALARPSLTNVTWAMAVTVFAIVWIGLPFAHAVLLRDLPLHGAALLVDVLVATFFTDTFAYVGGRMFGQRPLAPMVSPNKTVEGLVIGTAGGVLGFWLAGLYQDWLSGPEALLFGLVVALLAPMGDLFESVIKRDLDVKDTGRMLGPHGGLLDRLDAVLFTVVGGYYLALLLVL